MKRHLQNELQRSNLNSAATTDLNDIVSALSGKQLKPRSKCGITKSTSGLNPLTPRVKPWVIQSFLTLDSISQVVNILCILQNIVMEGNIRRLKLIINHKVDKVN